MVASLILSAAATAGMLSGAASQSAADGPTGDGGEISTSDRKKLWKSAVDGPIGIIKILNKIVHRSTGIVGINLSVASILRQSQIFTATVGAFFQILGAFVDATLAPLMPGIMKGLSWMADNLPKYARVVETVFQWIIDKWDWLGTNFFSALAPTKTEYKLPKKSEKKITWADFHDLPVATKIGKDSPFHDPDNPQGLIDMNEKMRKQLTTVGAMLQEPTGFYPNFVERHGGSTGGSFSFDTAGNSIQNRFKDSTRVSQSINNAAMATAEHSSLQVLSIMGGRH